MVIEDDEEVEFSLFQQFYLEDKFDDEIKQFTITSEDILDKYKSGSLSEGDVLSVPFSFDKVDESSFIKINKITTDRIHLSYCHVNHMLERERKHESEIEQFKRLGYPNELHKGYILIQE